MSSGYTDSYHVKSSVGTLITCDAAAKQILLHLDSLRDGPQKFVLRDVDDTHILIRTALLDHVKELLNEELEKNTYQQDPEL